MGCIWQSKAGQGYIHIRESVGPGGISWRSGRLSRGVLFAGFGGGAMLSKPKYGWWGYAKWIIRQYPAREGKFIQGKALEEQTAVKRAIDQTKQMENGMERIQVIEMVFFRRTHTLEGAALMVPCSYDTAQKYHAQFIKAVARNMGLMD